MCSLCETFEAFKLIDMFPAHCPNCVVYCVFIVSGAGSQKETLILVCKQLVHLDPVPVCEPRDVQTNTTLCNCVLGVR